MLLNHGKEPNHAAADGLRYASPQRPHDVAEKEIEKMNKVSNSDIRLAFKHLRASKLSESGKGQTLYNLPKELDYEFGKSKERGLQKIADHMLQFVGPIDRVFLTLDERTSLERLRRGSGDVVYLLTNATCSFSPS